jgi:hypothetical protein
MGGVWGQPDEVDEGQLETFGDSSELGHIGMSEYSDKFSGEPDQISIPELWDEIKGQILIRHGWHGSDYVWHICTTHHRLNFKISEENLLMLCAKTMSKFIPESVEVKIWLPLADWDIQEYTFKAMDLKSAWQVQEKHIAEINTKLFEVLNTAV